MRGYILTDLERKMLQDYLTKDVEVRDLHVLLYRIRKNAKRLQEDMKLILAVLDKERR